MTELVTWVLASLRYHLRERRCVAWLACRHADNRMSELRPLLAFIPHYYFNPFCSSLGLPWNPKYGSYCGVWLKNEASCYAVGGGLPFERSTSFRTSWIYFLPEDRSSDAPVVRKPCQFFLCYAHHFHILDAAGERSTFNNEPLSQN
jgi:hypothetical protein